MRASSLLFCLVLLLALPAPQTLAQEKTPRSITGYVHDAETDLPLPGVNVFLDGTLRGAATDDEGYFHLRGVPKGAYTLVASMVGYAPQETNVTVPEASRRSFRFRLKPRTIALPGLSVTDDRREWLKRLERFEWAFLGMTRNAAACELVNPEVLDFEVEEATETLIARARYPLRIINRALGYEIEYHLQRFETRGPKTNNEFLRSGHGRFRELEPENERQRRQWQEERLRAYHGSFKHFIRSLVAGTFEEEGFRVYRTKVMQYMQEPDGSMRVRLGQRVRDAEALVRPAFQDTKTVLRLDRGSYLQVLYLREPEERLFLEDFPAARRRGRARRGRRRQVSWVKPMGYTIVLSKTSGEAFEPFVPTLLGYWGWAERVANLLPHEYVPEEHLP